MSAREVRKRVQRVSEDNRSGSHLLMKETLRILRDFLSRTDETSRDETLENLLEITRLIKSAHPTMAALRYACEAVEKAAIRPIEEEKSDFQQRVERQIESILQHVRQAHSRVVAEAEALMPPDSTIVTLTNSSTVISAILRAQERVGVREVLISESRPMLEGVQAARHLANRGARITLTVDALLPSLCKAADLGLVGVDSFLKDGSVVSKAGTYPLALSCFEQGIPFYAAGELYKMDLKHSYDAPPPMPRHSSSEVAELEEKLIRIQNIYFDVTPARLISGYVTDSGLLTEVRRLTRLAKVSQ